MSGVGTRIIRFWSADLAACAVLEFTINGIVKVRYHYLGGGGKGKTTVMSCDQTQPTNSRTNRGVSEYNAMVTISITGY